MPQYLPLTRGETALVDDSDYATLSQWKWLYVGSGYAGRFAMTGKKKSLLYLHRFLLNAKPDERVDHINGDRLDNRRENLRLVTVRQNHQNRRRSRYRRSGYKGVCWHKAARKWDARIKLRGMRLHLGYDDDVETAALVYDAAARRPGTETATGDSAVSEEPTEVEGQLTQRVVALASQYDRYGYRRITALIRHEGWWVPPTGRADLAAVRAQSASQATQTRTLVAHDGACVRLRPAYPNHVWGYDFVQDRTHNGSAFRSLSVIDEYTRACLVSRAERRLSPEEVLEATPQRAQLSSASPGGFPHPTTRSNGSAPNLARGTTLGGGPV